jgi:hypothetical protein
MKSHHIHLLGATCLLIAIILTWSSQKQPPPAPPIPQLSQRTPAPKFLLKSHANPNQELEPFFESPLFRISAIGSYKSLSAQSTEDFQNILTSVFKLPPSALRDEAISYLLERLTRIDPEAAKQQWLTWEHALTDPWLKAASKICLALAKDDPFAPSDFINQLPRTAQLQAWQPLLWKMDENVASQVLAQFTTTRQTIRLARSLSIQWIKTDPEACATWLDSLIPTLSETQRQTLKDSPNVYQQFSKNDTDPLEICLATFHQAQTPIAREYLAALILGNRKITKEQKASFTEDLAETLPDYHAYLTSPEKAEIQKFYNYPEKVASTLQPADFKNLSTSKKSILISGLTNASPEKAARFLINMKSSSGLGSTLYRWYQVAPGDALAFTKNIPPSSDYQLTLFNFAMSTAHFSQEEDTLALINLIQSPARQQKIRAKLSEKREEPRSPNRDREDHPSPSPPKN